MLDIVSQGDGIDRHSQDICINIHGHPVASCIHPPTGQPCVHFLYPINSLGIDSHSSALSCKGNACPVLSVIGSASSQRCNPQFLSSVLHPRSRVAPSVSDQVCSLAPTPSACRSSVLQPHHALPSAFCGMHSPPHPAWSEGGLTLETASAAAPAASSLSTTHVWPVIAAACRGVKPSCNNRQ
jgi:hypothetical protein